MRLVLLKMDFCTKFVGEECSDMLVWYEKIGTSQERKSYFYFDYESFMDVDVLHVSDKVLVLSIDKYEFILNYAMDKNHWKAKVNTKDNIRLTEISMFTNEFDFSEMMEYYKNNSTISFNLKNPIWPILRFLGQQAYILWTIIERGCDAKIENEKNACIEKGECYTVGFCSATCRQCGNQN